MKPFNARILALVVFLASLPLFAYACGDDRPSIEGRWDCSTGGTRFVVIQRFNEIFLWTDNEGTYPASLGDDGVLTVQVGVISGDLSITFDQTTGELICPPGVCGCDRFKKRESNT